MQQQDLYAVYGASGCGRGIMPLARQQRVLAGMPAGRRPPAAGRLVFGDDAPGPAQVNGQRLMSYAQFLGEPAAARYVLSNWQYQRQFSRVLMFKIGPELIAV